MATSGLNLNPTQFISSTQTFSQLVTQVGNSNNLNNLHQVTPGQTIVLPDGSSVTVKVGDTLSGIVAAWQTRIESAQPATTPVNNTSNQTTPVVQPINNANSTDTSTNNAPDLQPNTENNTSAPNNIAGQQSSSTSSQLKTPRDNPLSQFSSYTYNISLYSITPESYNQYATGGANTPSDWKLIVQSGGINNSGPTARADGFELDYYIDNLKIVTNVNTKITTSPVNSFDFSFQVFEPHGFKFSTNLVKAVREIQQKSTLFRPSDNISETVVALQAIYLLVVRFYGYDSDGNVVKQTSTQDPTITDSSAALERSWPITISSFDFKLNDKMITYNIGAKLVGDILAMGRLRGVVGNQISIYGSTVGEMLTGDKGLIKALNARQQELVDTGKYEVKDTYDIKFASNSNIDTAKMVDITTVSTDNTPTSTVSNSAQSNTRKSANALTVEFTNKTLAVNDQPIVNVIDTVITQSNYIVGALSEYYKEDSINPDGTPTTGSANPGANSKSFKWFMITPQVTLGEYDHKRKTNSANITFIVQPHNVPFIKSFNVGKKDTYPGPYKRYQHTYLSGTGKEILSFEQNYNLLYFNLMAESDGSISNNDNTTQAGVVSSDSMAHGRMNQWFGKTIGPIKSFLYGPSTQLATKMTILGDPDYLINCTARGFDVVTEKYYGEDGWSINPTTSQIFIEIDFRDASDYDNNTGLLNVAKDNDIFFYNYPESLGIKGLALNVWQVTSMFSRGTFTQTMKFAVPNFDDPNSASNANNTSGSNTSNPTNVTPPPATAEANN